jgi:hypothetical protein
MYAHRTWTARLLFFLMALTLGAGCSAPAADPVVVGESVGSVTVYKDPT